MLWSTLPHPRPTKRLARAACPNYARSPHVAAPLHRMGRLDIVRRRRCSRRMREAFVSQQIGVLIWYSREALALGKAYGVMLAQLISDDIYVYTADTDDV